MSLGELRGCLDAADRTRIEGWAQDSQDPERRVSLVLSIDGTAVGRVLANDHRPDLERAGVGSGRHGFWVRIPGGLSLTKPHLVGVSREVDGAALPGSPVLLAALGDKDANLAGRLDDAVRATLDERDESQLLTLLATRMAEVLQRRADREKRGEAQDELETFQENWADHLILSDAPVQSRTVPLRRVLVVDDIVPDRARDAGSVAILSHMQAMADLGYEVSFAASQEMNRAPARYAAIQTLGVRVLHAPYYTSVEDVLHRQRGGFAVVYLHRLSNAARYSALVRHYLPGARLIYSVADLHHMRLQRQAEIEDRPDLKRHSQQVKLNEMLLAWSADAVITHSPVEAALLRREVPAAQVCIAPWHVAAQPHPASFAQRRGIAFIGSFNHAPNLDAAQFLADSIMGLVRAGDPALTCRLVGSAMPDSLRRLAAPGVEQVGHVADLDALMAKIRLTVAPLRYGAGVKGKVLESFARGVPCIMTPVAAEGLALPPVLSRLVGATAEDIAGLILELHGDATAYAAAREAGLAFIQMHHNAQTVRDALKAAIGL